MNLSQVTVKLISSLSFAFAINIYIFIPALLRHPATLQKLNDVFDTQMPQSLALQLSVDSSIASEAWTKMKEFYLRGSNFINVSDYNSIQGFIDVSKILFTIRHDDKQLCFPFHMNDTYDALCKINSDVGSTCRLSLGHGLQLNNNTHVTLLFVKVLQTFIIILFLKSMAVV